jgi:CDP-diacylglycerol--serine O-phosphatidyltransferase
MKNKLTGKTFPINRTEIRERLYRRRYLLPNAVTIGNLFCGFLTIVYATSMRFDKAVIAILIALLLDGLDGRVARRFNATSKFGVEFDSLADLVSFGIGPAILVYNWCFKLPADEFGVFVCFLYALCAACRLARFNVTESKLSSFEGLPSPAAAAVVATLVFLNPEPTNSVWLIPAVTLIVAGTALLMVSRIPFFSVKQLKIYDISIKVKIGVGVLIALIWYMPKIGLFTLALGYALSGLLQWGYCRYFKRS